MANQKISELDAADTLDGTELVPIVQGGATVAATAADIAQSGTSETVNTDGEPGTTIYVGTVDPEVDHGDDLQDGDVWLRVVEP